MHQSHGWFRVYHVQRGPEQGNLQAGHGFDAAREPQRVNQRQQGPTVNRKKHQPTGSNDWQQWASSQSVCSFLFAIN